MTHQIPISASSRAWLLSGAVLSIAGEKHTPFFLMTCRDNRLRIDVRKAHRKSVYYHSAMPFFAVQLAPYWEPPCEPPPRSATPCGIGYQYPAIRIAQARAMARAETETGAPSGVCITHDIGDIAGGIHPHNKTEVGRRLALEIRAKVFGVAGLPCVSTVVCTLAFFLCKVADSSVQSCQRFLQQWQLIVATVVLMARAIMQADTRAI